MYHLLLKELKKNELYIFIVPDSHVENHSTVLFNDEDFHSVKIFETVVRQSEVLAHRKKWLFCKVTPASIQTFVEGLLRLAKVLEATNGTLKNVNNISTLAINSRKYCVLFTGDLTGIR